MSGFEIVGAVAAGLQVAEYGCNIIKWIRKKVRDEKSLLLLRADCVKAVRELDACLENLSPGGQGAANKLRDRFLIVIQNIDRVTGMSWWDKFSNLLRIWNKEYIEDWEQALADFRNVMVFEANVLLQSIKEQQSQLEWCLREKMDDFVQRADKFDVIITLLQTKLADIDVNDKLICLQRLEDDIIQRLQSLEISAPASESLDVVSKGVTRIEKNTEQTKLMLEEQCRLLQEIHSNHRIPDVQKLIASESQKRIPPSLGQWGPIFTYRGYAEYVLSNNIYLPEFEIWAAINEITLAFRELYKEGYYFTKIPALTNLNISYRGYRHSFWTDKLGEFQMIPSQCRAGRRWVFTLPARRAHNILRVTSEKNRMKGYSYGLAAITVAFVTSFRLDMPYAGFGSDRRADEDWSMYHRRRLKEHIPQFLDANGDGDDVHRTLLVCRETVGMQNEEDVLNPRSKFHVLLRRLACESESALKKGTKVMSSVHFSASHGARIEEESSMTLGEEYDRLFRKNSEQ